VDFFLSPELDLKDAHLSTPVPEAHQDAARAQGKARFEQFVEQLGRNPMRWRSLVRDVVEELNPDAASLDDAASVVGEHVS